MKLDVYRLHYIKWGDFIVLPNHKAAVQNSPLTLLLKSCHDLHICHVLQFVAHGDGVLLQLRHPHLTVQRGLGADCGVPATHIWRHNGAVTYVTPRCIYASYGQDFKQNSYMINEEVTMQMSYCEVWALIGK